MSGPLEKNKNKSGSMSILISGSVRIKLKNKTIHIVLVRDPWSEKCGNH